MPDNQRDNQNNQPPQDAQEPQNPQDAPHQEQTGDPEQAPSATSSIESQTADTITNMSAKELNYTQFNHFELKGFEEVVQIARGQEQLPRGDDGFGQELGQAFAAAWSSRARGVFPRGQNAAHTPPPKPEKMPETPEAIETWFCGALSSHERCFVRATAILQGAPARAITLASQQLYEEFHVSKTAINVQGVSEAGNNDGIPNRSVLDNAFIEIRPEAGARRFYWQSSDPNGRSPFGLNILRLVAREIEGTGGMRGQNSEQLIRRWATQDDVETAWRAAHALGVIWWETDQNHLEHATTTWAHSERFAESISAAGVIFGAYEAEAEAVNADASQDNSPREAQNQKTPLADMKTRRLLRRLAHEARATTSERRAWALARTVATSCQLLAIITPDVAFDELDHFLDLEYSGEETAGSSKLPLATFLYGSQAYLTCAWNGQVRLALSHLARHAERLTHLLDSARKARPMRAEVVARYERALAIILFVVFFLATSSFTKAAASAYITDAPDAHLPPEPEIPDPSGRDILLAGILFDGEQSMRDAIRALLCMAILNGQAPVVSDILERWASRLFPESPKNAQEEALWRTYRRFIESVGRIVDQWDMEMSRTGAFSGMRRLRGSLLRWPAKKISSQIVTEALDRLGLTTP